MIYCLIGIPGSGKTTLAQVMVRYMNAVIIGRDPLREKLFGYRPDNLQAYYDLDNYSENEKLVTDFQDVMIKRALEIGKDVIVDNTHLELKIINQLKKYGVPIKFIPVDVDLEEAIKRDALRPSPVGSEVITRFHQKLEHLKKVFDFKDWNPEPVKDLPPFNPNNHGAFIFDIDGTLALNLGSRSPYDWKRVGEDDVNMPVKITLDALSDAGWPIILCSGRSSVCRKETEEWLEKHNIGYDGLFMREEVDFRKDAIVKEEMWRRIAEQYNIIGMFDDRQQVVDHARELGFTVFQVAEGNF